MKKIFTIFTIFTSFTAASQSIGINADGSIPNPSAMLDVKSTIKGVLPPRLSSIQRNDIINPAEGLVIYNSTSHCLEVYRGVGWFNLCDNAYQDSTPSWFKDGLVAYYPFNGNANDESGNGNNCTVNGATLATDRNGNSRKAYSFNGISDNISFNLNSIRNTVLALSEFTTSVWVKTSDLNGPLISMQGVGGFEYNVHIGTLADIVQNPGNYGILVRDNCCGTGNNIFGSNVVNNVWHMLTVIRLTNGTLKLYKDGILDATSSGGQDGPLQFSPNLLAFGADLSWVNGGSSCSSCNSNDQQHLNGMLDDIGIWNRALTQSEITYLYNH